MQVPRCILAGVHGMRQDICRPPLRIHVFIYILHLLVDLFKNAKPVVVYRPILWIWSVDFLELYQPRHIHKGNQTQSHSPDPGCAACVGINWFGNLPDLHIHHIRKNLAPDV